MVGSNLAFKGQPLLITKEKKKSQTPVQFWLLNKLLRKPRVLPLPCRLVQAHEDCRRLFPLASQKQRVQVLPFSPAWYRRSGKEKADAKCIHQDCLFSLCCVLGVMKDPVHRPQPAATQQNAACWKVTELSAPSDKAAHVSFSGTRDGGGGGSHIC